MRDEICDFLVKKHNLPVLIDEKNAVGKTVRALTLRGHNALAVFTDNTAVFIENEIDQYDQFITGNILLEPNWPYILSLHTIHDKETQTALEMEYLTLSRKKQAEQAAAQEKTEYERLKTKFEGPSISNDIAKFEAST